MTETLLDPDESMITYTTNQLFSLMYQSKNRLLEFRRLQKILENVESDDDVTMEDVRKLKRIEKSAEMLSQKCQKSVKDAKKELEVSKIVLLFTTTFFILLSITIAYLIHYDVTVPEWAEFLFGGLFTMSISILIFVFSIQIYGYYISIPKSELEKKSENHNDDVMEATVTPMEFRKRQLEVLNVFVEKVEPAREEFRKLKRIMTCLILVTVIQFLIYFLIRVYMSFPKYLEPSNPRDTSDFNIFLTHALVFSAILLLILFLPNHSEIGVMERKETLQ